MGWTPYQWLLVGLMFSTGSLNTLSAKWADLQVAQGREGYPPHAFDHPFLQAVCMFIGELLCLFAFLIMRLYFHLKRQSVDLGNLSFNPLIFLPPALCDMTATSLMFLGLNMTYASSYQMLRGSVMIFTALLSVAFLGRNILPYQWLGIVVVALGLAVVGISDVIGQEVNDLNGIIAGDLIILIACVVAAGQMVYEERFVTKYKVHPLQAVGWEGLFGLIVLGLLNIPFAYIDVGKFGNNPLHVLEDPIDAFLQMSNSWQIMLGILGLIASISVFNFSGISVTKELSATTRMVLDSLRTIAIWAFSLIFQWQKFSWEQIIGFILLMCGAVIYNNFHRPLLARINPRWGEQPADDQRHLVRPEKTNEP